MDVRVISLKSSTDRRATIARTLGEAGVAFSFFDALDGHPNSGDAPDAARVQKLMARDLAGGELGCYRSHLALWRLCAASGAPMAILEDDIQASPDLGAVLDWLAPPLEARRYIRLAAHNNVKLRGTFDAAPGGRQLVRLSKGPYGTFGYAISAKGAAQLLKTCGRIERPVDQALDRFWENGLLPYAVLPYPVFVDPVHDSLIDAELVRTKWRPPSRAARLRLALYKQIDSLSRRLFNLRAG